MEIGDVERGGVAGSGVGKIEILDSDEVFFGDGGDRGVLVHFLFFLKHFDDDNT